MTCAIVATCVTMTDNPYERFKEQHVKYRAGSCLKVVTIATWQILPRDFVHSVSEKFRLNCTVDAHSPSNMTILGRYRLNVGISFMLH